MSSAFSIEFLEPTSEFQTPVTFLLVDRNTKCGYSFSVTPKIVYKKKKIQIVVMNKTCISSREARKCMFHSSFATNEICIFMLHSMKYMAYSFKTFEYHLFIYFKNMFPVFS